MITQAQVQVAKVENFIRVLDLLSFDDDEVHIVNTTVGLGPALWMLTLRLAFALLGLEIPVAASEEDNTSDRDTSDGRVVEDLVGIAAAPRFCC